MPHQLTSQWQSQAVACTAAVPGTQDGISATVDDLLYMPSCVSGSLLGSAPLPQWPICGLQQSEMPQCCAHSRQHDCCCVQSTASAENSSRAALACSPDSASGCITGCRRAEQSPSRRGQRPGPFRTSAWLSGRLMLCDHGCDAAFWLLHRLRRSARRRYCARWTRSPPPRTAR